MLDTKQFISAIKQIAEEKGIPEDKVVETIEAAIAAAYKRDYGEKGQIIKAKLNQETGDVKITQIKYVVEGVDEEGNVIGEIPDRMPITEETTLLRQTGLGAGQATEARTTETRNELETQKITEAQKEIGKAETGNGTGENGSEEEGKVKFNPEKYLTLEEAKKINKKFKVGDEVVIEREPKTEFGRIAAQTAKQVIIQRLREVEREAIFAEFKNKEGEVISGIVQRLEGNLVYVDLGRTTGLLIPAEQLYQEHYRIGQRLRFLILRVEETPRGPIVLLSRSHPKLVLKLFEFEVPEIDAGSVEIKAIAREAGSRSKIAVVSTEEGVDPIGSLVGQKGVRVQTVINELGGEKIDIIEWNEDQAKFILNALSPAKIVDVKILDEQRHHALAEVADDQFSLAIGKKGQNVRLAAKLTGWKIDVRASQARGTSETQNGDETQEGIPGIEEGKDKIEVLKLDKTTEAQKGQEEVGKEIVKERTKTAETDTAKVQKDQEKTEKPGKEEKAEKPKKKTRARKKKEEKPQEVEPLT